MYTTNYTGSKNSSMQQNSSQRSNQPLSRNKSFFEAADAFDDMLGNMIEDIFLCYDDDQNGVLSKEEMEEFTASCLQNMENEDQKMLGINLYSPEIFNNFFEKYDQDKNGVIDKDEMLHFLKEVAAASKVRAENVKSQKQNGYQQAPPAPSSGKPFVQKTVNRPEPTKPSPQQPFSAPTIQPTNLFGNNTFPQQKLAEVPPPKPSSGFGYSTPFSKDMKGFQPHVKQDKKEEQKLGFNVSGKLPTAPSISLFNNAIPAKFDKPPSQISFAKNPQPLGTSSAFGGFNPQNSNFGSSKNTSNNSLFLSPNQKQAEVPMSYPLQTDSARDYNQQQSKDSKQANMVQQHEKEKQAQRIKAEKEVAQEKADQAQKLADVKAAEAQRVAQEKAKTEQKAQEEKLKKEKAAEAAQKQRLEQQLKQQVLQNQKLQTQLQEAESKRKENLSSQQLFTPRQVPLPRAPQFNPPKSSVQVPLNKKEPVQQKLQNVYKQEPVKKFQPPQDTSKKATPQKDKKASIFSSLLNSVIQPSKSVPKVKSPPGESEPYVSLPSSPVQEQEYRKVSKNKVSMPELVDNKLNKFIGDKFAQKKSPKKGVTFANQEQKQSNQNGFANNKFQQSAPLKNVPSPAKESAVQPIIGFGGQKDTMQKKPSMLEISKNPDLQVSQPGGNMFGGAKPSDKPMMFGNQVPEQNVIQKTQSSIPSLSFGNQPAGGSLFGTNNSQGTSLFGNTQNLKPAPGGISTTQSQAESLFANNPSLQKPASLSFPKKTTPIQPASFAPKNGNSMFGNPAPPLEPSSSLFGGQPAKPSLFEVAQKTTNQKPAEQQQAASEADISKEYLEPSSTVKSSQAPSVDEKEDSPNKGPEVLKSKTPMFGGFPPMSNGFANTSSSEPKSLFGLPQDKEEGKKGGFGSGIDMSKGFGNTPTTDQKNIFNQPNSGFGGFGGNKPAAQNAPSGINMSNGFGNQTSTQSQGLFGQPPQAQSTGGLFGGPNKFPESTQNSQNSLFGKPQPLTNNLFKPPSIGEKPQFGSGFGNNSNSLFGGNKPNNDTKSPKSFSLAMNQPGVEEKKDASLDQDLKVIIAPKQRRFDKATDELKNEFKDVDLSKLESLTLSGNSYGLEACKWIGENVLSKAKNLKYAIFSDLFVSRLRAELPESLLYLMDNIMDKNIIQLDLSHNAFGPDGVKSFQKFLSATKTLQILDVSNCGLGPRGGQMIGEAILKNPDMKLKELYATRDRLEQDGMKAIAQVIKKQKTLVKIELLQNGSKIGLRHLFDSLLECKANIKHININDNLSINKAIPQLKDVILNCKELEYLNISNMHMKKGNAQTISNALIDVMRSGDSKLKELYWGDALNNCSSVATQFLKELSEIKSKNALEKLHMPVTFNQRDNRKENRKLFKGSKIQITLFQPNYSDDDSEDNDYSEEDEEFENAESASSGQHYSDPEDMDSNAVAPTEVSNQKIIFEESILNESIKSNKTEQKQVAQTVQDQDQSFELRKNMTMQTNQTDQKITMETIIEEDQLKPKILFNGTDEKPKVESKLIETKLNGGSLFGGSHAPAKSMDFSKQSASLFGAPPAVGQVFGNKNLESDKKEESKDTPSKLFKSTPPGGLFGAQNNDIAKEILNDQNQSEKSQQPLGTLFTGGNIVNGNAKKQEKNEGSTLFGAPKQSDGNQSIFGAKKSEVQGSVGFNFGKTESTSNGTSMFGAQPAAKGGSLFGGSSAFKSTLVQDKKPEEGPSKPLFVAPSSSLFGKKPADQSKEGETSKPIFGAPSGNLFGQKPADQSSEKETPKPLFGVPQSTSLFGNNTSSNNGSLFGSKPVTDDKKTEASPNKPDEPASKTMMFAPPSKIEFGGKPVSNDSKAQAPPLGNKPMFGVPTKSTFGQQ